MGKKKKRKIKDKLKRGLQKTARKIDEKVGKNADDLTEHSQGDVKPGSDKPVNFAKGARKKSGIRKDVIGDIHQEMMRQCIEGIQGWSGTPLNPMMPDGHKFVLLERQAGNVAASLADDRADSAHLYRECVRSAVVAAAWAASLKAEGKRRPTQWATS